MEIKIKNTKFILKRWTREEGKLGPLCAVLYIMFKIFNSVSAIFVTSEAILVLQDNKNPIKSFLIIIVMISFYALSRTLENYCCQKVQTSLFLYRIMENPNLFTKLIKLTYEYVESSIGKKDFEKAVEAVGAGNEIGVEEVIRSLENLIIDFGCLIIFLILSASLHPIIMIILLVTGSLRVIKDAKNRKWILEHQDERNSKGYELRYLQRKCLDNKIGKDVRIYKMQNWFYDKLNSLCEKIMIYIEKKESNGFKAESISILAGMFRDVTCYGYLVYRVTKGMSISNFVLYLGVISGLNVWIKNIFEHYASFAENIIITDNFRTLLERKEVGEGEYELTIPKAKSYTYIFENVSFSYENGIPLFENLNLTIKAGEKIALVGANGAGKTTLIKLMSGLYKPKSGRVLVNGVDISKVNPKELLKLTGIVFQDTKVFPESIEKNISCNLEEESDETLVSKSLKAANLYETVQKFVLKEKTILTKNLEQSGTELSGGQYQKLMLARALYKNASVLILDEPTAALDPLAEADMYLKYHELTKGKTSVFISHRLSSTQFCDRVIFLEKGKVKQDGSHEKLLKEEGPYKEMFLAQAHYYMEGEVI